MDPVYVDPNRTRARQLVEELNKLRELKGLNHKEFATRSEVHESHWHNLKAHRRTLRADQLVDLANALDLEVMLVERHHLPFLLLDPAETRSVVQVADYFRRNKKGPFGPFQQAIIKLTEGK